MAGRALVAIFGLAVFSCGTTREAPSPRYAEVPPRMSGRSTSRDAGGAETLTATSVEARPSDGQADAAALAADAGVAPQGPAVLILATEPMTDEQWRSMLSLGRRKFNVLCGGCHSTGIAPGLVGHRMTADRVRRQIRLGGREMPPISVRRLEDQEMEAVLVFLSTIRAVRDVNPPPSAM